MVAGRESVQFDIFANDRASAAFLRVGQTANNAADNVAQLSRKMDAVNSKVANARVAVTGDTAANLALDRLLLKEAAVAKRITPEISVEGAARAGVALDSIAVAADAVKVKAAAAGTTVTRGGFLAAAAAKQFSLFGGALKGVPILGAVTGLHLLADAAIEVTAVVVPAAIAFGAFGIAAVPAVQNVVGQLKTMYTVMQATGKTIPPLTGAFQKVAAAVQPQVYQLFGEALLIASHSTGTFMTLATGAGRVVDQLAARFEVAITSGHGFSVFTANAVTDLAKLGDIVGNLGGVLGNVFKAVPGYAQTLVGLVDAGSRVLEWASSVSVPVLRMGLAFHGAFLYIGLLATGVSLLVQRGLPLLAQGALQAGIALEKFGPLGAAAATGMTGFAAGAEEAAGLPWGWITLAAAGFGVLAYALLTAKDATAAWVGSLQQALSAAPAVRGFTLAVTDQVKVSSDLAFQQRQVAAALKDTQSQVTGVATRFETNYNPALDRAATASLEARQALTGFAAQQAQATNTVIALSKTYGNQQTALGLLTASGVTFGQISSKNAEVQAQLRAQVAATAKAYQLMGQTGGKLGADMYVINYQAADQFQQMQKLNTAWTTYLGLISQTEGGLDGAITAMRATEKEAKNQSASFTGVNKASIALQDTFWKQLIPGLQTTLQGMQDSNAPTKKLAETFSTLLNPAIKDGALKNHAMFLEVYSLAREIGYHGIPTIQALTKWINRNSTSLKNAANNARTYAGVVGKIPNVNEKVSATGTWAVVQGASGHITGPGGATGAAAGTYVRGGTPGRDSVPIMAMPGEVVVPTGMVRAGAVDHLRGSIPGFAAGGVVPSYSGSIPGVWKWALGDLKATQNNLYSALARDVVAGIKQAQAFAATGGPGGGAPAANAALARRMYPPWASGAEWLAWNAVAMRESGWSQFAYNPSGAYGIPQSLPFTKMPKAAWPPWAGGSANPAAQIGWMIGYIKSTYGDPIGAWNSELTRGFYDRGGFLPPGLSLAYNGTGRPERVVPHTGRGAGGQTVNVYVSVGHGTHPVAAAQEIAKVLNVGAKSGVRLRTSILGPG